MTSGPPSSSNQSFSAGKGIPECTVCHQSPDGAGADLLCPPGGPCRAGVVGLALRQLDRYIRAPVPTVKASRPPPIHRCIRHLGLQCIVLAHWLHNGPSRPPYLVLHSKSNSQLPSQQQCGVPFEEVNSFSAIVKMQQWSPK